MQHSHPYANKQPEKTTITTAHRRAVAQKFPRGRSPRVEELIGYTDASRETGLSIHQLQYAATKGELIAVPLPNGKSALIESQVRSWAKVRDGAR